MRVVTAMAITYYKRFRMEIDLDGAVAFSVVAARLCVGAMGRTSHGTACRSQISQLSSARWMRTYFRASGIVTAVGD